MSEKGAKAGVKAGEIGHKGWLEGEKGAKTGVSEKGAKASVKAGEIGHKGWWEGEKGAKTGVGVKAGEKVQRLVKGHKG